MKRQSALLTDFYELTMMQGYFRHSYNPPAVFELFFRKHPFGGGITVCAGLETVLLALEGLRFDQEDCAYLASTGVFHDDFLEYLKALSFTGDIRAVPEGEAVFPGEPLVQVHAPLLEAQWVESLLLNVVNFQTLIATKTQRICRAAGEASVIDFGLRRAHGPDGAVTASRAAYIGGATGTSNTLAGKEYGIPVKGTMAHSWVMAFGDEKDAFDRYSQVYPDGTILLIDTVDTLESGLPHAIEVGRKLQEQGAAAFGVRLDSGDIGKLSRSVRKELDAAGLEKAVIVASNDLDEYSIEALTKEAAPVDIFGVGTRLITAFDEPALGGVYKLVELEKQGEQVLPVKVSDDPEKNTLPGIKQVYRCVNHEEEAQFDLIALENEEITPSLPSTPNDLVCRPLLELFMEGGRISRDLPPLEEVRKRREQSLAGFPANCRSLEDPQVYPVILSSALQKPDHSINP